MSRPLPLRAGKRPVTLVAFSLGCTVVFECLLRLAEQERLDVDAPPRSLWQSGRSNPLWSLNSLSLLISFEICKTLQQMIFTALHHHVFLSTTLMHITHKFYSPF